MQISHFWWHMVFYVTETFLWHSTDTSMSFNSQTPTTNSAQIPRAALFSGLNSFGSFVKNTKEVDDAIEES